MESEQQTRKKRIDTKLREAGWEILPYNDRVDVSRWTNRAIEEYPTANGPADYVFVR